MSIFSDLVNSGIEILLQDTQPYNAQIAQASQENLLRSQDMMNPFSLGTFIDEKNPARTRKEIYSKWEQMLRFAPIAEAMGIHVAAALGGDPATGEQVFITPAQRLKHDNLSPTEKKYVEQLEQRIPHLQRLINQHIVKICRDAICFGDSYVRVYSEKGKGITKLLCNELTYPPLIQAYEHVGETVAFHVLESDNWYKQIAKLSRLQMLRMKMPRMTDIKQQGYAQQLYMGKVLQSDNLDDIPIVPAKVGGSFCAEVERIYDDIMVTLSAMNSQQIADAVQQVFLQVDMSAMSPAQRQAWITGFTDTLTRHKEFITSAFKGGQSLYATNYHLLPVSSDKQVISPMGDIKGQRSSPINIETFMLNVRLLMGGLGLDPSMVGWADMLAGGLGDGASFHTSSQIMKRSMMIRQACKAMLNDLIALDWGQVYGEVFDDEQDYVWDIQFYSDQSSAMTEIISNNQARMGALSLQVATMLQLKETGLSEPVMADLLERNGGFDYEVAKSIAKDLAKKDESDKANDDDSIDDDLANNDDDLVQDDEQGGNT